jgi:Fe-S-cluster containining protein
MMMRLLRQPERTTFAFCARCPSNNNCCVRKRHGLEEVASPPLFSSEAKNIAAKTGLHIDDFSEGYPQSGCGIVVKRTEAGCYFYKNGRCEIYSMRPFDCKIFPFDIIRHDETLHWIMYDDLCPPDARFSYDPQDFEAAKKFLRDSKVTIADLEIFIRHGENAMAQHRYLLLEPVQQCLSEEENKL